MFAAPPLARLGSMLGVVAVLLAGVSTDGRGAVARSADYETGDFRQWEEVQPSWRQERAAIVTAPVRGGRYAARFEVRAGDSVPSGGELSQAAWSIDHTGGTEGQEWYYAWSTYIPSGQRFKDDLDWNVLTEWLSPAGCPPPLQLGIYPSAPLRMYLDATFIATPAGEACLVERRAKWFLPLETDQWMDFVAHVRWSSDPELGFVELWQNGVLVVPRTPFPTLYPGFGVYLKEGFYRRSAPFTNVVFNDEVRRAARPGDLPRSYVPWLAGEQSRASARRTAVEHSGRSWERYLREHQRFARAVRLTGVSRRGTVFHTRVALATALERRGLDFSSWWVRHREAAAALDWAARRIPYAAVLGGPRVEGRQVSVRIRAELARSVFVVVESRSGDVLGRVRFRMPQDGVLSVRVPVSGAASGALMKITTSRGNLSSTLERRVKSSR